ncbi:peptide ABC transporter substrate-binding protein [Xaviernesmea oryzae]|uniref:Peptide ABC transporter substrate-binding protein n=1 Tax=Xaviernesmea oryzae TaxID=464029 RepID=A0A1Q9B1X6_9HYPH|nr:ABC transporter substrate-binding protein [Xaviernesmea oryzae]OLP62025.1 peptide ABC transporter substrate-binding protein [Xaviernesmea oryzae]SEK96519.1 peptide/nickel transport system substrate-binding protein [Xaviernesmea oryzae]
MSSFIERRATTAAALIALLAAGLAGTGVARAEDVPAKGGTLIYATDREPTCLDPHVDGDMPQVFVAQQYTDSLVSQDKDGRIGPWLAKDWTISDDGKVYTFHLRDDVTFTNGEKFNAAAVKANLDHIINPATQSSTAGGYIQQYLKTETPDEHTAVVYLKKPYAAFLEVLAQGFLGIEAPSALARGRDENCQSPVGSGPFKVVKWDRKSEIVFERNPDYKWAPPTAKHQGPAYLDRLVWKIIPEPSVRFASLAGGNVDVIESIPPEAEEGAAKDGNLTLLIKDRPGNPTNSALNTRRAPFDDIRVREAFVRSADIQGALDSVFFGRYQRAPGPLSAVTPFASPDFQAHYDYDPDRANKLLDEAGWSERNANGYRIKDGKTLTVEVLIGDFQGPAERSLWEQIQATAAETGFEVKLQNLGFSEWLDRMGKWQYDAVGEYWNTNTADVLRIVFSSEFLGAAGSGGYHQNATGFSNPAFDEVVNKALETTEEGKRRALYLDAQKIIASNYLQVLTFPQSTRLGIYKTAQGVRLEPSLSVPVLYDAWVRK